MASSKVMGRTFSVVSAKLLRVIPKAIDAATRVAEVPHLVLAGLKLVEQLLELRGARLFRAVGKSKSVRYRVTYARDLDRVG